MTAAEYEQDERGTVVTGVDEKTHHLGFGPDLPQFFFSNFQL